MTSSYTLKLANDTKVSLYPKNGNLEAMVSLVHTPDFLQETEVMKEIGFSPPFNLLVYDQLLALGLSMSNHSLSVGIKTYSDESLLDWVDMALSLRKHPIRVVEKTTQAGEMFRRLKPRIDLDWIEYDAATQTVRERQGFACAAQNYLQSRPPSNELYALREYKGQVEVIHMRIDESRIFVGPENIKIGAQCVGHGKQFFDTPIADVEAKLRAEHPNALVLQEPLTYCSISTESKPWACLAHLFELIYAKKRGLPVEMESPVFDIDTLK